MEQLEFDFAGADSSHGDGYRTWKQERAMQLHVLSEHLGLPLGRKVELTLLEGAVLKGTLRLVEERLWIEEKDRRDALQVQLCIGRVEFTARDVASCVVVD